MQLGRTGLTAWAYALVLGVLPGFAQTGAPPAKPAPAPAAAPVPTKVVVRGLSGAPLTLTMADLAKLHRDRVIIAHGAKKTVYEGATLGDILRQAHAPMGAMLHGANVAVAVLATGADGYHSVLSIAEADPGFRHEKVILADHADGQPLSAREGPFRLVVEGDDHPARNIRQTVSIELRRLP